MPKVSASAEKWIYLFSIAVSILLSLWFDLRETVINPDAICYLLSAEEMGQSGIRGAMQLCGQAKWPFYSLLIYYFVQLSHFSYPAAAYLLNGLFSLFSVLFFILIVKKLGGTRRVLWLAALVILFSHVFNSARVYIVRDHGFWAFYLISVFLLLCYFQKPKWLTALLWSASLLVASLFRIEAVIFLLLLPMLAWCSLRCSFAERVKHFCRLHLLTFVMGVCLCGWLIFDSHYSLNELGRLSEILNQVQHGFTIMLSRYQVAKIGLIDHVLGVDAAREAGVVLLIVLCAWYCLSVLACLSCGYVFILGYAFLRKIPTTVTSAQPVLLGYVAVNMLITLCFLFERFFLSKRYLIALALILMLWIPFALHDLLQKCSADLRLRFFAGLTALFIFSAAVGGVFDFGYSKSYIHEAGDWLADNVPAKAALYANDYQLMYYSQHFGRHIFQHLPSSCQIEQLAQGRWKQYDYIALRTSHQVDNKTTSLLQEIQVSPVRVFSNKRGDKVTIYRVNLD